MQTITIFEDADGYRVRRFVESGDIELTIPENEAVLLPVVYRNEFERNFDYAMQIGDEHARGFIEDTLNDVAGDGSY